MLFVALFAVGCQLSGNGGSLKAEQIVFDMECQISVSASEKVACGTLKNSGTETVLHLQALKRQRIVLSRYQRYG